MIEFRNVSFSYEKHGDQRDNEDADSLQNIDLTIEDGECVLLCGKSGCGKTTVTRLVNGLIPHFYQGKLTGEVLLNGQNISEMPMYETAAIVGSVFQNPRTQFFNVDTDSEIAFGVENQALPQERIEERVAVTAKDMNIENLLGRNIFSLSGGEKQKIAFASVYAMDPSIYLLDEPSSNLDMATIGRLLFLRRQNQCAGELQPSCERGGKDSDCWHIRSRKSTIAALVSRFYDVTKGEVLIGGKNVREIGYGKLLEQISLVFQKTFLTCDSVFDNIRMGSDASLEQVREAAREAQIDDFIMSLPNGYDTKVGSYGSRFSGGEKQRIAIARAILKNAPILLLDEATSAADPENQVEIDKAIESLCAGKTVIIIAHRLGVIKMCDRVAVVENHTVSDVGTHDDLMKRNAYYRTSWEDYERARNITYGKEERTDE